MVTCCPLSRMSASRSEGRLPSRLTPSRKVLHLCSFVGPKVSSRCCLNKDQFSAVGSPNIKAFMVGPIFTPIVLSKNANFCLGSVTSSRAYADSIRWSQTCMFCLSSAGRSGRFRLLEFACALAAGRRPRLNAWRAAVAASSAVVMRSCCRRSSMFSCCACSAILRSSSAEASAEMGAILGLSGSSASSNASASTSSAAAGGKNWGPETVAGEGDREPRPRPRG